MLRIPVVLLVFAIASPCFAQNTAFDRMDQNGDGKLSRDELPERIRGNFSRVDTDGDGFISRKEDENFRSRRGGNAGGAQGNRMQGRSGGNARLDLDQFTVVRDAEYVTDGHERHKLDLYVPKSGDASKPLVVFIHGGGWQNGSKNINQLRPLLSEGFACAAINYRLSGHATFPAQIHDCKAAIRWLRTNAEKYGYDGSKIGVWGSSAGGHLVALTGTSGDVESLEGDLGVTGVSSRVQAVCDYYGPTDLTRMEEQAKGKGPFDHNSPNSPESKLLGGPVQDMLEAAKSANPITYVTPDDPPFYIVHGDHDFLVPIGQSELLKASLDEAGVSNSMKVVPGGGHGGFRDPELTPSVVAFFKKTLGDPSAKAAE